MGIARLTIATCDRCKREKRYDSNSDPYLRHDWALDLARDGHAVRPPPAAPRYGRPHLRSLSHRRRTRAARKHVAHVAIRRNVWPAALGV
jgi:hypothetical protein